MKTKQEYDDFFNHMQESHIHGGIGGMGWDEIGWWSHDAVEKDKVYDSYENLYNSFPILFSHMLKDNKDSLRIISVDLAKDGDKAFGCNCEQN